MHQNFAFLTFCASSPYEIDLNFKCDNDDDSLDSYRSKRGSFGGEYASGTENDGEQSVDDDGGGRK